MSVFSHFIVPPYTTIHPGGDAEVELLPDDLRLFSGYCLANPGHSWLILDTLGKSWLFSG